MEIEHFTPAALEAVGARFRERGRMLPDGLSYCSSWVAADGATSFQVMEAADPALLDTWIGCWNDLVRFEVVPVQTSSKFWASRQRA